MQTSGAVRVFRLPLLDKVGKKIVIGRKMTNRIGRTSIARQQEGLATTAAEILIAPGA